MSIANIALRLESGDTQLRLARFAMDSSTVRESWRGLPADVRLAQGEMTRLAQTQIRMGHMRARDREAFLVHQERVTAHRTSLQHAMGTMRGQADAHPLMGWYSALQSGGSAAQMRSAMQDPSFAGLHANMQQMRGVGSQLAGIDETSGLLGDYGATGRRSRGQAASYWGRRAAFGAQPDGTPLTAGQSMGQSVAAGFTWTRTRLNQAADLFTLFEGIRMVTKSMHAYEEHAETVQDIGAQLGGAFQGVTVSLKNLREEYALTLDDIKAGLTTYAGLAGTVQGADSAVRFARATGLSPDAMLGAYGRMAMYGKVDPSIVERGMSYSGMAAKPGAYMNWLGATVGTLGHGMADVPSLDAARYVGLVANAMGPGYQNERGQDVTMRLLGGMRGAGGTDPVSAVRMHAVRGLRIPGMPDVDTGTYRGMQAALDAGSPEVMQSLYREAVRLGGRGEMGAAAFQKLAGRGLNVFESDRIFREMGRHGMPDAKGITAAPDVSERLEAVRGTDAYRMQALKSEMETSVYEPVGAALKPIALDFQEAAKLLAVRIANASESMNLATELLAGIGEAATYLRASQSGARYIFEFGLLRGSLMQTVALQTAVGVAQAGANATGGVNKGRRAPPIQGIYRGAYGAP